MDVDIDATATGGIGGDGGGGPDEGVDETGTGPMEASECLFQPESGYYGYKYQCVGRFNVKIEVDDLDPEFLVVEFGTSNSPDSYEDPHVMACCPEYEGPPCAEPHQQACVIDMVEQGCKSLVPRLEQLADDRPLFKEPILRVADFVAQGPSQHDCLESFLSETDVLQTMPSCDANDNAVFHYDDAVDGAVWSFNPDTTDLVDHVALTLEAPELLDLIAPGDPPQPEQCRSSGDNDHLSFLEVDPTIGDIKPRLAGGSISLLGPVLENEAISGSVALASAGSSCSEPRCSHAAWTLGPFDNAEMHSMSLYAAEPADVGTSMEELTLDSFQIHLFTPVKGAVTNGMLTFPAGAALFVVSGTTVSESRLVSARNSTPIEIQPEDDTWSIGTFTIDYEDAVGDVWSMNLAPSTWR